MLSETQNQGHPPLFLRAFKAVSFSEYIDSGRPRCSPLVAMLKVNASNVVTSLSILAQKNLLGVVLLDVWLWSFGSLVHSSGGAPLCFAIAFWFLVFEYESNESNWSKHEQQTWLKYVSRISQSREVRRWEVKFSLFSWRSTGSRRRGGWRWGTFIASSLLWTKAPCHRHNYPTTTFKLSR